jgi:GPH family glycoside/pentoside/hexuronide:cation symporter
MFGTYGSESLAFFVRLYYVCGGDQKLAAAISGTGSLLTMCSGLAAIPLSQWFANRFGKRAALMGITILYLFSGVLTLVTYTPQYPWLQLVSAVFTSMAFAGLWIVIPSMTGDVADYDELQTHERREGAFASAFSWTLKVALSGATAIAGLLVVWAGFDSNLKTPQPDDVLWNMRILLVIVPVIFLGAAIWIASGFPLTTRKMVEIREALEQRRGKI